MASSIKLDIASRTSMGLLRPISVGLLCLVAFFYIKPLLFTSSNAASKASFSRDPKRFISRVIAIGDLHGDLDNASKVLRLAGLVDHRNKWIGKTAVLGQIKDRYASTSAFEHRPSQFRPATLWTVARTLLRCIICLISSELRLRKLEA